MGEKKKPVWEKLQACKGAGKTVERYPGDPHAGMDCPNCIVDKDEGLDILDELPLFAALVDDVEDL